MADHGEIPVPGPGGDGTDNPSGDDQMPEDTEGNVPDGDISNDSLELMTEAQLEAWDNLIIEGAGNTQGANSIVRYSAARKFNQEDPIEAAATEMILNKS